MIDDYHQYIDNLLNETRSCYTPGGDLVWQIPKDLLEDNEPEFGTYAANTSNKIEVIHEEEDEPAFIEELEYQMFDIATVRTVSVLFEDFPSNKTDPKAQLRITEWENGEGFDFAFTGGIHTEQSLFSMTYTRFDFLMKLVGTLSK